MSIIRIRALAADAGVRISGFRINDGEEGSYHPCCGIRPQPPNTEMGPGYATLVLPDLDEALCFLRLVDSGDGGPEDGHRLVQMMALDVEAVRRGRGDIGSCVHVCFELGMEARIAEAIQQGSPLDKAAR